MRDLTETESTWIFITILGMVDFAVFSFALKWSTEWQIRGDIREKRRDAFKDLNESM
jgi:hypothetical protein